MLLSLFVKNYAIIQSLRVEFEKGLNILSGETGAGKSIIVGSLSLLLGSRGSADMIRAGEKKLTVEGVFTFDEMPASLKDLLSENDIDCDDELIIRREINDAGKNVCRVNDVTVSVNYLKSIGSLLVDIHGQHEHQRLLSKDNHIYYLDMYGGEEISDALCDVKVKYEIMRDKAKVISRLKKEKKEAEEKTEEYILAVSEIEKVSPEIGEDERISSRLRVLESAEKIYSLVDGAYENLYSKTGSVVSSLGDALSDLEKAEGYDSEIGRIVPMLRDAFINIEESVNEIRSYRSGLVYDPYELENLNERLMAINRLKRKYGEIDDILEKYSQMKLLLEGAGSIELDMKKAYGEYEEAKIVYTASAETLTALRKKYADEFAVKIISELGDMAISDARFEVRFEKAKESDQGCDDVEFFIATNKGQPLRELAKTASGGEISRIMLALKNIIGSRDETETMIFDEIDTGISGNTATVVGRKMADISRSKQIIAITHLAQIASMADGHYLIEKKDVDDMTSSTLRALSEDEKITELARIIGSSGSETALIHAKSLYEEAIRYKDGLPGKPAPQNL